MSIGFGITAVILSKVVVVILLTVVTVVVVVVVAVMAALVVLVAALLLHNGGQEEPVSESVENLSGEYDGMSWWCHRLHIHPTTSTKESYHVR